MKLLDIESKNDFNWVKDDYYQMFALVGAGSCKVHMVFAAESLDQAYEVMEAYHNIQNDSGYILKRVQSL